MDAAKIAAFNSGVQALNTLAATVAEDGQSLGQAEQALTDAQAVVNQRQGKADADVASMQTAFDALVAAGLDLGLKVNLPAA
jgi:hypothetical protein